VAEQHSLFENHVYVPLATRLRPDTLEGYFGQTHLLGESGVLRRIIESDQIPSMIFWGPPGVGKTTLARIIAHQTNAAFIDFSAVTSGIKEIRGVMQEAENNRFLGQKTILFVDEIHRFNKAQQDAFLPFVEKGSIILIGATTENPSFEINSALLSRCRVFVLQPLSAEDVEALLRRAVGACQGDVSAGAISIDDRYLHMLAVFANGDARVALNTLEMIVTNATPDADGGIVVTEELMEQCLSRKFLLYDKSGEEHYNIISALHKSMRNSDVQAAVYWLARMLEGGEDPLYIARRVTRFASEDIGMADSRALEVCVAAYHACHFIGMPECSVHLTHAVVYCALAPKSNALYTAYGAAARDAQETIAEPVPLQIRNAPTKLMKELDYGKGYQYAHHFENKITGMRCLPDALAGHVYYEPTDSGKEAKVREWMEKLEALRRGGG
jgi:putative ATPase